MIIIQVYHAKVKKGKVLKENILFNCRNLKLAQGFINHYCASIHHTGDMLYASFPIDVLMLRFIHKSQIQ